MKTRSIPLICELNLLRRQYPEFARAISRCRREVEQTAQRMESLRVRLVLKKIDAGCATVDEITDRSRGLPPWTVRRTLLLLLEAKIVEERIERRDGERGKPKRLYFRRTEITPNPAK